MAQDHHYQVTYYDKNGKADDSSKRFADENKAKAHAFRGNAIDKVGGKYKVHKVMSPIDEATDAPFDGPYTNTFKKKSNPNRTGMDAARSLAQRGIAKAKVMSGNEKFSSNPDKLKKQHFGMSEDFTEAEVDEMINEVLSKDASAGDWISDFMKSDAPQFQGKSKEKLKQMALAAYYAKQNEGYQSHSGPSHGHAYGRSGFGRREREDDEGYDNEPHYKPVAPVPDRKYIRGTPEHKAYKATKKPINGHPTNVKEEAESIDELSKGTLGSYIKKAKGSAIGSANAMGMTSQSSAVHKKAEGKLQKRASGINKAVDRLTEEEVELDEHLVHVNDGSKYGEQPHDKDAEHVMAGVKKHNGEFDGHSDKGAFFKFKTADDAKNFKRHVDSCPHKTCDADLHESTQNVKPTVKTDKYSWGTMKTIHHGSSFSIPLHPEHHEHIAKMKDQQVHTIKTEDGRQWHVKREGDTVHFHGANGGSKTSVPHKSLAEESNKEETMKSYKEFLADLQEHDYKGNTYVHKGKYGTSYDDPEGKEDDAKPAAEKAEKRGRGRPAGSKSGARQLGGASKKGSGVEYTGFKLHLPNSNR